MCFLYFFVAFGFEKNPESTPFNPYARGFGRARQRHFIPMCGCFAFGKPFSKQPHTHQNDKVVKKRRPEKGKIQNDAFSISKPLIFGLCTWL
ncbi:hypothetical protein [Salidesulfovibrio brasiliensis]|uniref:hypothetical protein n=1 Tax=Salidesulfovibrio brasiliensis TaxID=221711 RepID=UPI000B1E1BAD|nr:hypothetical protein [Salidesulfovibrio brasiliensis]